MRFYIIIFIFLSLEYAYNNASSTHQNIDGNSDCLTDELHGDFTDEELTHLITRRKNVREFMNKNLHRNEEEILIVDVVFHNLYKTVDGTAINSYCDFGYDVLINDQDSCNTMMLRSLEVLNAQYLPSGVQFELHDDYPEMLQATDPGYDGFFDNATGDNLPTANDIKEKYNIQNVLNIYTTDCLGIGTSTNYTTCKDGLYGYSTYPKDLKGNKPGVFIIHKGMPGSDDTTNISTLAHEIGHFFSLLHINGLWFFHKDNIPRELVSGLDCDVHGDLICDTPGSPGHETSSSWYIDSTKGECIYHGYGGDYNPIDSTLIIGGINNISTTSVIYNYCDEWNFVNPYGFEHCESYTNYDNIGEIFGTRGLLEENQACFHYDENGDIDLLEYSTECHINNYLYLPKGDNFMGPVLLTQPCAQVGHPDYDNTKNGFTDEQYANIKNSLELDYTYCDDNEACNPGLSIRKGIKEEYFLRSDTTSCLYPCNKQESGEYYEQFYPGCLKTDPEYDSDYPQDNCPEKLLFINENIIPHDFGIHQVYPNPFNPTTTIYYSLSQSENLKVMIYDITGRLIVILVNEFQSAGFHSITWDASNFSSGIYFLKMSVENFTATRKLVLIK